MGNLEQTMAHFILFINRNSLLMKQILTIILFTSCFITYGQSNMGEKTLSDKQENAIFIELDNIISNHYQEKKIIYSNQMTVSEKNKLNDLNIKFKNDFKNLTLFLEVDSSHAKTIIKNLNHWKDVKLEKDLVDRDRYIIAKR